MGTVLSRLPPATDRLHATVRDGEPRALPPALDRRPAGRELATLDGVDDEPPPRLPDSGLPRAVRRRSPR